MRRFLALLLMLALGLSTGCASKYGEQKTSVNYYPACYQPIQDLRNNENYVGRSTAGGALLGAFSGALVGLLASGGKWQGAVTGAAVGGAAGTMAGNLYGRKQQERDDNARLASYLQDIDGDISNLDVTSAAARASLQCYDKQFQLLVAAIKARQITREAAAARFGEITSGREEAIAILGDAVQHGDNLNQEYEQAFAQEEQQIVASQRAPRAPAASAQKTRTIQAARQRKQTLVAKTAAIKTERQQAVSESSRQTQEINSIMAAMDDIRR